TLAKVKSVPWWVPAAALAGTLVPFLTMDQTPVAQSTGALLHLAAYGWIERRVLRMTDTEWRSGIARARHVTLGTEAGAGFRGR
ncbi:hypothetical protein, partial [Nonomuraea sp. NPDC023979]|uniref:hypothetical protein n=1 Tax=Nonomuraea sp. NPDC023979 TaxID=3154796 RepID=UPI0033C920CE